VKPAVENPNLKQLLAAARKLHSLLNQIVFVGGCATGLLVTDPGASPVRPTLDVDAIIEIATQAEYVQLQNRLHELGFVESTDMICRWRSDDLVLDLMPVDASILGFSNRWYQPALKNADEISISGITIRLISGPYFLATKLIAFHGRGKNDYVASHDLEDIVTVIDGRSEIAKEVGRSETPVREFLRDEFRRLLHSREFLDSLPGHLLPDTASQQRFLIVVERMREIAK
jgi:predicted nucleotidyltransferase